jgi:hypothetical protein
MAQTNLLRLMKPLLEELKIDAQKLEYAKNNPFLPLVWQ